MQVKIEHTYPTYSIFLSIRTYSNVDLFYFNIGSICRYSKMQTCIKVDSRNDTFNAVQQLRLQCVAKS